MTRQIDMIDSTRIAIFGGQGRFGTALRRRLGGGVTVTVDKTHNNEIAENVDIAVIAVQPEKVEALLHEISPVLKEGAHIVSFVARYPLKLIHEITGKPSARAMADPWWNVSAVMRRDGFSEAYLHRIFNGLTKNKTIRVGTDREMDDFTLGVSHAFIALLSQQLGIIKNVDEHLEFIAPRIGLSRGQMGSFLPTGDPQGLISLAATKGGISEAMLQAVYKEPDIKPSDLQLLLKGQ